MEKISNTSIGQGRSGRRKVKELEEKSSKENLKLIASLNTDQIINCIEINKDKWDNILKVNSGAFAEFIKLNSTDQETVLSFNKDKILSVLTKELMQDLLTILNNTNLKFKNNFDEIKKEIISYANFTPEAISYIAKKSPKEQESFFVNYREAKKTCNYNGDIQEYSKLNEVPLTIDMDAVKLYEEIFEENKNDDKLIAAGASFWYFIISSKIKLDKTLKEILISCIDSEGLDFWKRTKSLLKNDKFKTLDEAKIKALLNPNIWLNHGFSKDEKDLNNMADWLMFTIEQPHGQDLITLQSFCATLVHMHKYALYFINKKDLANKFNKHTNAKKIYAQMRDSFNKADSKIKNMKTSSYEKIAKIMESFIDAGGTDLTKLSDDLENFFKSI